MIAKSEQILKEMTKLASYFKKTTNDDENRKASCGVTDPGGTACKISLLTNSSTASAVEMECQSGGTTTCITEEERGTGDSA